MNFDFSPELKDLRETARAFLTERCGPGAARRVLETSAGMDRESWEQMAEMGWLAASIPEEFGGLGLGHLAVCVLAAEIGRSIAPVPFSSSVYIATEALLLFGNQEQKRRWLPGLAAGTSIGTFACVERPGFLDSGDLQASVQDGLLNGAKVAVADAGVADIIVVAAKSAGGVPGLYLASREGPTIQCEPQVTIDPSRGHARVSFNGHPADLLAASTAPGAIDRLVARAAVMTAFEQLGVAEAALDMACNYAKERFAFGRPIGSFQAIKHKLADVYIATELARSNCYYGAWALDTHADELAEAAAVSRVSAGDAAWLATKENIQTHGGMGFTWDMDCHLYYRRAGLLGLMLGGGAQWKRILVAALRDGDVAGQGH
jgi:acyl-CoA dehydrogenase